MLVFSSCAPQTNELCHFLPETGILPDVSLFTSAVQPPPLSHLPLTFLPARLEVGDPPALVGPDL